MQLQHRVFACAIFIGSLAAQPTQAQLPNPSQFVTSTPVSYADIENPGVLGVADFNGDGRPDILVSSSTASGEYLAILLQNADGTFTTKQTNTPMGQAVWIADFNGDGKPDVITATAPVQSCAPIGYPCVAVSSGKLNVALGNGDGTFTSLPTITLNFNAHSLDVPAVVVADLNDDGSPDIAVSEDQTLQTFLNDGTGHFRAGPSNPSPVAASPLAAGDFSGNGKADLVVATASGLLQILKGKGDGSFTAGVSFSNVSPGPVVTGDFNRDGHLDMVVVNANYNQDPATALLLGNGDGTFKAPQAIDTILHGPPGYYLGGHDLGVIPESVATGDFNHDGYPDLAFTYVGAGNEYVSIFRNSGQGTFEAPRVYDVGPASFLPGSINLADFNGDGNLDLLAFGGELPFEITFGDQYGNFAAPVMTLSPSAGAVAGGDFNGDGVPDVAVVNEAKCVVCNASVTIFFGSGQGYFTEGPTYTIGVPFGVIAAGDVNGDGKTDLVVTRNSNTIPAGLTVPSPDDISVLLGNGNGTFEPAISSHLLGPQPTSSMNRQTWLIDVNHDGKPDLIGDWGVALGRGNGEFAAPTPFPAAVQAVSSVVAGDFNRDGNVDLVVAQSEPGVLPATIYTLLGNGKGTFTVSHQEVLNYTLPLIHSMVAADLNGDGILDLAYLYQATPNNTRYSSVVVESGKGDGTFAPGVGYRLPYSFGNSLLAGDFNGDGHPDLLITDSVDIGLLRGGPGGTFNTPIQLYQGGASSATVLDLNKDGIPDVVGTGEIGVFRMLNTGNRK